MFLFFRFVKVLDEIDVKVEGLRKDALMLQSQSEMLQLSIELLKNHELFTSGLDEYEREEIECYVQRIGSRLSTIELSVRTLRDSAQEDSLHQVNRFIEELLLSNTDPVITRQKCQHYLNACNDGSGGDGGGHSSSAPDVLTDKKFEGVLLSCTIDDQKHIKKRLLALMEYLSKQSVTD